MIHTGHHFLQIPGPTNVPDRILRAMDQPVIDHRGPEFADWPGGPGRLTRCISDQGSRYRVPLVRDGSVEAALVNTLSADDRIIIFETGQFSNAWRQIGERLGLDVVRSRKLAARRVGRGTRAATDSDGSHAVKAVVVVHNETSTGVTSRIPEVRRVMSSLGHPALLIVDAISSLACIDYRMDEWEVDVTVCGSQKGLMVPPGLGFNAVSEKALLANKNAKLARSYWDWQQMVSQNEAGFFPLTPATNLLFALREALKMMREEEAREYFAATRGMPKPHAQRCAPGDCKSFASRWNIPIP